MTKDFNPWAALQPAYLPKNDGTGMGTKECYEYIQEFGAHAYLTEENAAHYAKRLEMGEGGKWGTVAIKHGPNVTWRAHRIL